MKKEALVHFLFLFAFFVFVSIKRDLFTFYHLPFWLGGIVGTILPDLDHLLYAFFLRPQELLSQRAKYLVKNKEYKRVIELFIDTRYERTTQIFHTVTFQLIFLVLTFLIVTSSGSIFGTGLVLAFSLHFLVDQIVDFFEMDTLDTWFRQIPVKAEKDKQVIYWLLILFLLLLIAFVL